MEAKKPFIPPPPKELKVPPRPANNKEKSANVAQKAPTVSAPQVQPVVEKQTAVKQETVQQAPVKQEQKTEQPEKKKRSAAAPLAFIIWGSIAVLLIILFIVLKDKI